MGIESAFEDHFKLGNYREGRRENCCDKNVSSSHFAAFEIEYEDRERYSGRRRREAIGRCWASWLRGLSKWR